jgi:hypothetical protein
MPKIVFCADRMISAGLQFEHGEAKIQWLTASSLVMVSSNKSLRSDMIVKSVQMKIAGKPMTTEAVADLFKQECIAAQQDEREQEILIPLGLSYKTLWEKSSIISKEALGGIMGQLENYESDFLTQFIVLGIDQIASAYVPHIYIINQDGEVSLQDYLGFGVIGSGYDTAFPELTKYVWNRNISLSDALARVYNAKVAAQRMAGVGEFTDLSVLYVFEGTDKVIRIGLWDATPEARKLLQDGVEATRKKDQDAYVDILKKVEAIFVRPQTAQQTQTSGSGTIQT